jgi:hypothetical protein
MKAIPLKLINLQDDGFHLLVEIVVFKQKYFAVVDSGASRTVFDKSIIETHLSESELSEEINAATLFTTTTTVQATIPKLKIGKLSLKNYHTVAFDLQTVRDTYEQFGFPPIYAIIGSDILLRHKAIIDYGEMTLKLSK